MIRNSSPISTFNPDECVNITDADTSPITAFIRDDNINRSAESDTSSMGWLWPENQLGLEPEQQYWNDEVLALDKKGKIKYQKVFVKY